MERKYRFELKAKIHSAGYRTVRDFGQVAKIDEVRLSRILNGWEIPSSSTIKAICKTLKLGKQEIERLM